MLKHAFESSSLCCSWLVRAQKREGEPARVTQGSNTLTVVLHGLHVPMSLNFWQRLGLVYKIVSDHYVTCIKLAVLLGLPSANQATEDPIPSFYSSHSQPLPALRTVALASWEGLS